METKELIQELRSDAEWAHANEWETPITLGDHLDAAADAIEALLAEVERLNEKVRFQNKLLHAPVVDIFPNLTPKEKAEDAEIVRLENELHSVTAERDSLIKDFTNYAKGGTTDPSPYCANKAECIADDGWCILERCDFRPNACRHGEEQNDG